MAIPAPPAPELLLSPDDARRITLRAQGFLGSEGRRGGVPGMLRRLGAVQLDTISVLARSHELVAYARLGPIPRDRMERACCPSRSGRSTRSAAAPCVPAAGAGTASTSRPARRCWRGCALRAH